MPEQNKNEDDMPYWQLCRELYSSINSLNNRIDELDIIFRASPIGDERRKTLLERRLSLSETRMRLIYSFTDLAGSGPKESDVSNPFRAIDTAYNELRRKSFATIVANRVNKS